MVQANEGNPLPAPIAPPNSSAAADPLISVVPPPFLIGTTVHLSNLIVPEEWKLPKKLSKKCLVIDKENASETKKLRSLNIPIERAESVVYLCAKKDNDDFDLIAQAIENNSLSDLVIARTRRTLLLTRGSVQMKSLPFGMKNLMPFKGKSPNIKQSIFDLRGIHVCSSSDLVIVAYEYGQERKGQGQGQGGGAEEYPTQERSIRYALYQTTTTSSFLEPLTKVMAAAYSSFPRWAIPISWSGDMGQLPAISKEEFSQWLGFDGGFSSSIYAAALAFHVKHKLDIGHLTVESVYQKILEKNPVINFPIYMATSPRIIDLVDLAKALSTDKPDGMLVSILIAGLNALSFNLIFRKLKLSGLSFKNTTSRSRFRDMLARTLLYNVTLREIDFQSCDLSGFGEWLGGALAMNAQPLISRINFSNCKLTGNDLRSILHGLARAWCGGTALAESISMANNPKIPDNVWDAFFQAFVDPSTLTTWPRNPPPPPNLSFLQELDIRGTNAIGLGLAQFARKLRGLRSFKVSASDGKVTVADILRSLLLANAPLEKFEGDLLSQNDLGPLFEYNGSLREVTLHGFKGDAGLLLSNWPQLVPKLSITIGSGHSLSGETWAHPPGTGYSPAVLSIANDQGFGIKAMDILTKGAPGLRKLFLTNMYYWEIIQAAPMMAVCGLETLHIGPPRGNFMRSGKGSDASRESFWAALAPSKTLCDLQIPDQLTGNEVAMVGRFLKANRSVKHIGFDNSLLILTVDNVKVLRSAFYGNKKVVSMQYLEKAGQATREYFGREIKLELRNVAEYKRQIKMIFKRAYSKYNSRWRDGPNREKLPWVEKIRVSKRRIGQLERDQRKIATLLDEIKVCVCQNKQSRAIIEEQKGNERLVRREGQIKQLAVKKEKYFTKLVTSLHRAKVRGRQQKSAKTQVPRSHYYKSPSMWPSNKRWSKQPQTEHSYYRYYNDPYYARSGMYYYNYYNYDQLYPCWTEDATSTAETCPVWDSILPDERETSCEPNDPWANVDALIQHGGASYGSVITPGYLALLHEECSELGIDVVENVSGTLDTGAAVADKLDEIGESTNVPVGTITNVVDSTPFDLSALEETLPDVPEDGGGIDDFDDGTDAIDAGDAVTMYAGAGPRDLDDGGPSYGGPGTAALAGARRRARARKSRRIMRRVRESSNYQLKGGYKNIRIKDCSFREFKEMEEDTWPNDLVNSWNDEVQIELVKAAAESDLFDLPDSSGKSHYLLTEWSFGQTEQTCVNSGIDVVLVTQCSLDRLPNLEAQLACWTGRASVAIYLTPTESSPGAICSIFATIDRARNGAKKKTNSCEHFDVAITVVEGCIDDEPYPINYLRNVALLEAQEQHLRFHATLEKSAVLLVDVDFRPSFNLHKAVHSQNAELSILKQRKVVVCPAFETTEADCPHSITGLRQLLDMGKAEGFHHSHFPSGHGPTQFDLFWDKSLQYQQEYSDGEYCWQESYPVHYEKLFEPYVIMATSDVPLYDERFQGYGLNKVAHLQHIAMLKGGDFVVLPGIFLVAPAHKRSKSWAERYGKSQPDENSFNQLILKGLYHNFTKNLEDGGEPVISETTRSKSRRLLLKQETKFESKDIAKDSITMGRAMNSALCY